MTQQDKEFIQENIINFESVRIGFLRNIPLDVLNGYETIYRKYLDANYILTAWCSACVMDMMKRLIMFYDSLPQEQEAEAVAEIVKPKRGRPARK